MRKDREERRCRPAQRQVRRFPPSRGSLRRRDRPASLVSMVPAAGGAKVSLRGRSERLPTLPQFPPDGSSASARTACPGSGRGTL